ncbi:MAG: response regulator [Candidatus Dormibacteraceae bacterium]
MNGGLSALERSGSSPASGPVHILIVEDDPAVADMYRLKLEMDGYDVAVAPDGEAAVEAALVRPPDLVFLDIRLPKLDGIGVLERMRAHPRLAHVPVVVLSNYSERGVVDRCLALGAREYLVKSRTTPARLSERAHHHLAEKAR